MLSTISVGLLMNAVHVQQHALLANSPMHYLRGKCRDYYLGCSPKNNQFTRTQLSIGADKLKKECGSKFQNLEHQLFIGESSFSRSEEHQVMELNSHEKDDAKSISDSLMNNEIKKYVELQRRRKIGMANKGRTPWNKGIKHRPETRELIKRRTIEAMRDPKVRKKMSENPRCHSAESKAKIGSSQRRRWEERLKHKNIQEKCYWTWSYRIAEAAKEGSQEQQELKWDSYEKFKADIVRDYLQWKSQKARAKEFAKLKAVDAEKAKAVRRTRCVKKEKEEKAQSMEFKRPEKKPRKVKESSAVNRLKLVKTTKLMLPILPQETADDCKMAIQKWDLEFIKQEKLRRRVSLADQIQAAKSGLANSPLKEDKKKGHLNSVYKTDDQ